MSEIKNVCLRLSQEEYVAFDTICREKGFSKTGKIREFIRDLIKKELPSVKASAAEWARIEAGIKEIERGEYITFEELDWKLRAQKMGDHKDRKNSGSKHRNP